MTTHKKTFRAESYGSSAFTRSITWTCSCGKSGSISDGRTAPTMKRAKAAADRHTEAAR